MARSRKRAEKGLCTKEESDAFCSKSEAALKSYLDKQVKEAYMKKGNFSIPRLGRSRSPGFIRT